MNDTIDVFEVNDKTKNEFILNPYSFLNQCLKYDSEGINGKNVWNTIYNELFGCIDERNISNWTIDLSNQKFVNCDLSGYDLHGSNLYCSKFVDCNLQRIILRSSNLTGARFKGVNLSGAILSCSILSSTEFTSSRNNDIIIDSLDPLDLSEIYANKTIISSINFTNIKINNSVFIECKFNNAIFRNKDITNILMVNSNFQNVSIVNVNFINSKLIGLNYGSEDNDGSNKSKMQNVKFINSQLSVDGEFDFLEYISTFTHISKYNENNSKIKYNKTIFNNVMCRDVSFNKTNLNESSFHCCQFIDTDFEDAKLNGTTFEDCILLGSNFSYALVNGNTLFRIEPKKIKNYINNNTDFTGVSLESMRITPQLRTRLSRNVRKKHWDEWIQKLKFANFFEFLEKYTPTKEELRLIDKRNPGKNIITRKINYFILYSNLVWKQEFKTKRYKIIILLLLELFEAIFINFWVWLFWKISDYGSKTFRILVTFIGLNIIFALIYKLLAYIGLPALITDPSLSITSIISAFAQSTIVIFGVTDASFSSLSWISLVLSLIHVVLGYVILAALITRMAVIFENNSPA